MDFPESINFLIFQPESQPELYQWAWLGVTCPPVYAAVTNTLQLAVKGIEYLAEKYKGKEKSQTF